MALEIKITLDLGVTESLAQLLTRLAVCSAPAAVASAARAVPPAVAVQAGEHAAAAKAAAPKPAPKAAAPAAAETPAKRGPGRPPKVKAAPPPSDDEDEEGEDDLGIDLGDESDAEEAQKGKLTYEGDLLPAIISYGKSFADKTEGSTKVKAILKTLGVSHPRDIPEDKFEAVLKKIGKLK